MKRCLVISIEGNIGTGKTTIINELKRKLKGCGRIAIIPEPAEEWLDKGFLPKMYRGEIDAVAFQHMVLISLASKLMTELEANSELIITERSPFSNFAVFAKMQLKGVDLELYEHTWKDVVSMFERRAIVRHVVLQGDPKGLLVRIQHRNRKGEECLQLDQLAKLEEHHTTWLKDIRADIVKTVPYEQESCAVVKDVCNAICDFISEELQADRLNASRETNDRHNATKILLQAANVPHTVPDTQTFQDI